ncbi:MAG: dihydropteroate synthase [Terriglobia bacterium]
MNRKRHYWKLRTTELQLGERTLIMGILNVTPDSFSDGGHYSDPDRAYARAMEMEEQGVDIIDIGAESTKPDSKRITADEEWQRLVPVLKRLRDHLRVPLSLDTYKSEIAERALEYGIEIFNDPSGLTFDPDLAKVAAAGNAGLILNHMRGLPETWAKLGPMQDAMGSITKDLEATVSRARRMGVEKNRIVIDPGIGFGKRKEQNSEILAHLAGLAQLDLPILVGPSRKSFLTQPTGEETSYATAAAVAVAILNGAHIVRVHDVKEMRAVALVTDEIVRAGAAVEKPAEEAAERPVRKVPRRESTPFVEADKPRPTRAPLSRPPVPLPNPEPAEPFAPAARKNIGDSPVRRAPQDRPSKGWTPDRSARPPYEKRSADTGPRGRRPDDRPRDDRPRDDRPRDDRPRRDDRTARPDGPRFGGPSKDRPAFRGKSQDRPPFRPGQGRPPRGDFPSRPSSGPAGGRPPRGPSTGRPPAGAPPRRPFRKRP